jgi:hypothetical protein
MSKITKRYEELIAIERNSGLSDDEALEKNKIEYIIKSDFLSHEKEILFSELETTLNDIKALKEKIQRIEKKVLKIKYTEEEFQKVQENINDLAGSNEGRRLLRSHMMKELAEKLVELISAGCGVNRKTHTIVTTLSELIDDDYQDADHSYSALALSESEEPLGEDTARQANLH